MRNAVGVLFLIVSEFPFYEGFKANGHISESLPYSTGIYRQHDR